MQAIRLTVIPDKEGEIHITDLPIPRGRPVELVVLTGELSPECRQSLDVLDRDESWAFLKDRSEDLYSLADLKERYE